MQKMLVIVDMQNDFVTGALGSKEAEQAVDNLCDWIEENITEKDIVVFTKDTHFDNYLRTQEGRKLPIPHCIYLTYGWEIVPKLQVTVTKTGCMREEIHKSTFGAEDLDLSVDDFSFFYPDEVIFAGVCTDICVVSNALILKAREPEIPMAVLADCCAGTSPENHEAALKVLESCQFEIWKK